MPQSSSCPRRPWSIGFRQIDRTGSGHLWLCWSTAARIRTRFRTSNLVVLGGMVMPKRDLVGCDGAGGKLVNLFPVIAGVEGSQNDDHLLIQLEGPGLQS